MDFPQFFRTGLQNLRIKSDRWRGLAVLCKTPETQQSYRGIHEDDVLGVTGSGFTNRMVASMTMLPHMKVASGLFVVAPGTPVLPAQPGVRYLMHACFWNYYKTAIGTCSECSIQCTINGVAVYLVRSIPMPLVFADYSASTVLDVVTDVNTAVSALALTENPAGGWVSIYYAEIGAS